MEQEEIALLDDFKTYTAMITPFVDTQKEGHIEPRIDYSVFEDLVDKQLEAGNGLVILGTTAETPCLDDEEKVELINRAITKRDKHFEEGGRYIPIIVGASGNRTKKVLEEIRYLNQFDGINGLLVATPEYNKPQQRGIYQHYKAIQEVTQKAIMAYDVPSRTGVKMEIGLVNKIADLESVFAIKAASGDLEHIKEMIQITRGRASVYSGDDPKTNRIIRDGGNGVVSVLSNLIPEVMQVYTSFLIDGENEITDDLEGRYGNLFTDVFHDGNPASIKYLMLKAGLIDSAGTRWPIQHTEGRFAEHLDEIFRRT